MAPIETPATILSTIPYGETSKIARLATRELGVVSVIAKGARRPRSAFGASLQILSDGIATVHLARHSDLHTLSAFDVGRVPEAMATNIERYAVATVLGELMLRFAPGDRQAATYDFFRHGLDVLEGVPAEVVAIVGLRSIWGLVAHLGFAPALGVCARDGLPVGRDQGPVAFSPAHGGVLCAACARAVETSRLTPKDLRDLEALIEGRGDLPALDSRYLAAHRRLLDRYVRYHLGDGAALPALGFWSEPGWVQAPG
ncbi:MAG: DNA repair protein RecO [Gemmatimonadales bacterium]|nr:DNA repair protein RecO [Gemmatimonadales bacterium]